MRREAERVRGGSREEESADELKKETNDDSAAAVAERVERTFLYALLRKEARRLMGSSVKSKSRLLRRFFQQT